jgi:hypothetical protein
MQVTGVLPVQEGADAGLHWLVQLGASFAASWVPVSAAASWASALASRPPPLLLPLEELVDPDELPEPDEPPAPDPLPLPLDEPLLAVASPPSSPPLLEPLAPLEELVLLPPDAPPLVEGASPPELEPSASALVDASSERSFKSPSTALHAPVPSRIQEPRATPLRSTARFITSSP